MAGHWARSFLCAVMIATGLSAFGAASDAYADEPAAERSEQAGEVPSARATPRSSDGAAGASTASAPSVQGAAPATPPPEYERAIDRAVDEHDRGHFEEAREHFRAAHEIYPNARTLRGLGKSEFELRNYGESVRHLTDALAATVRPLPPELRDEVQNILERARAYVGEVHVAVQPGTASVSVDGVTVATGPQAALALQVGDHVLEFRANGRIPERRHVRVHGRDQINIQVVLSSPEVASRSASLQHSEQEYVVPARKRWWVWTAAGVVAAGAATALAISLRRDDGEKPASGGTSGAIVPSP